MKVVRRHLSASSFMEEANDFLSRSEAENMLMLGLAGELARSETGQIEAPYPSTPLLVTVKEGTAVVMAVPPDAVTSRQVV